MGCFKHFGKTLTLALWVATSGALAKTYRPENLPSAVKRAVTIMAYTDRNLLTSSLKGETKGSLFVRVQLETRNQYTLYADKVNITLPADDSFWEIANIKKPPTMSFLDPVTKKFKGGYTGQVVFDLELRIRNSVPKPLGIDYEFPLLVDFQACNKELCLLPVTVEINVPLRKNAVLESAQEKSLLDSLVDSFRGSLEGGGLGLKMIFLLFLAGLLTAFTPCVYPLYPITIGIFVNWGQRGLRSGVLGLCYCAGSIFSYSLVGLAAVLSGKLFGSLTQTPVFQIGVGLIILLSALFYSGLFEFALPQGLLNFFQKTDGGQTQSQKKVMAEAFLMGVGLGVVASPCVGPILVALIAWMSSYLSHSPTAWIEGFFLFAVFGTGLMTPFLFLSIFAAKGARLPRLGHWMQKIKWGGSLLMVVGSLFFLVPGIKGLMPAPQARPLPYPVYTFEMRPAGTWTMLDFRADWCVACLELEADTFRETKVVDEIKKNWSYVRVDATAQGGPADKIIEQYSIYGLPTVLFVSPTGEVCKGQTLTGFERPEEFLHRLQQARTRCQ